MDEKMKRIRLFISDPAHGVVGRNGIKLGEDSHFLFILNEEKKKEAIQKSLIVRYLEE